MKSSQASLESILVKAGTGVAPYPLPGRGVRAATARAIIALYTRGDTRTLFETVLAFLKVAAEPKPGERDARV